MARRYYVVEEDRGLGCCNLVIWDFLLVAFLAGYGVNHAFQLHTVFCIVIGVVAGALFVGLMGIKKIGKILQLVCSLFWAMMCWELLKAFHWGITESDDMIWVWAVRIGLFVIFAAIHFASAREVIGDQEDLSADSYAGPAENPAAAHDSLQKRYDALVDAYNESTDERDEVMGQASRLSCNGQGTGRLNQLMRENDVLWQESAARMSVYIQMLSEAETSGEQRTLLDKAEELLRQMQLSTKDVMAEVHRIVTEAQEHMMSAGDNEIDESLFAGCNSRESLQKRYKNLMKTFHPDNADGDETMAVKISATYEELLKRYK